MNRSTIENKHRHYVDSFNDAKTKLLEDIHKLKQSISTEKSKYKQLNLNKKLAKLEIKLQEEMDKELDYLLDVAPLISDVKKESSVRLKQERAKKAKEISDLYKQPGLFLMGIQKCT